LIIEVDGDSHGDDEAPVRDAQRTAEIEACGYRVIRFWNDYVLNDTDGGVHATIVKALMGSTPSVTEKARLAKDFFLDPLPDPLPCGERGTIYSR
jgi:very-short-patch-repair endonuclease